MVVFDGRFPPFDDTEPVVGNAVIEAVQHALTLPKHLGYMVREPSLFEDDPLEVRRWVSRLDGWGAILVNNNASALLKQAVENGDTTYDPMGAGAIIYDQARDLETINQYVAPALTQLCQDVVSNFGRDWVQGVLRNSSLSANVYARSPQALSPAIGFSTINLRPFDPPNAIPSVTIGLIYLIIIAYFSFSFFAPIHAKLNRRSASLPVTPPDATTTNTHPGHQQIPSPTPPPIPPTIKLSHILLWRYLSTLTSYLLLSLTYSLVSLAFVIPFHNPPPSAPLTTPAANPNPYSSHTRTWPTYWMLNFLGMTALGLACENVGHVIGTPWLGMWLVFWVITNVSTGFYDVELAPGFYGWGYVWPLHSLVEVSRGLLFDVVQGGEVAGLERGFGVLIVWAIIGTLLWPGGVWVAGWRVRGGSLRRLVKGAVRRRWIKFWSRDWSIGLWVYGIIESLWTVGRRQVNVRRRSPRPQRQQHF